jgi:exopolysaccharide biosynthesis polyprenyl glycosylphosphotransferase
MGLGTVFANPRWFVVLTLLWWLVASVLNTYDVQAAAGMLTGPLSALRSLSVVAVVYFFIPILSAPLTRSRLSWAIFFMLATTGLVAWRLIYASVLVQPHFRKRLLIAGAGRSGETILSTIREGQEANYKVVGFVDDDPEKVGTTVGDVPVLGSRYDLIKLIQQQEVGQVILAVTHEGEIHADLFQALMDCHELGVDVTPMVLFYEELTGRVPVEHIGQQLSALLPLNHNPLASLYRLVRRVVDLAAALVGLAVLALILPLVALLVRLDSPGPIFFRQTRVGKGGRQFQLIKFRTMVEDAERPGEAVWAKRGDNRVTRFGRFARKVRLDEMPQLWNVLRGEMSLIGPRPERPEFVEQLEEQIPFYRSRHAVKPGITGWAQVNYRYGGTVEDTLTKLQYDLYYIKHQSFYLDLLIFFRTVGTVLSFRGR